LPAPDQDRLKQDHIVLCEAVREAGALAMQFYQTDLKSWDKGSNDPVTEADMAVNELLHAKLAAPHTDYGWLSEETEDDLGRLNKDRVWVVDPIDGTRAFMRGKPHFTICAALVDGGRPVCAAVFNPATEEFYDAVAGGGARRNDIAISVTDRREIAGCRMVAFGPMFKHPAWPEPWPNMEIIERNSMAYRLALVADGQADAAMALNAKSDWDLAAADLIVCEAGGRITSHQGAPLLYNQPSTRHRSLIAAGPDLYDALLDRVGNLTLPD